MIKKTTIASLFGHSPFGPLQEHMRQAIEAARLVPGLFEAVIAGNPEEVERIRAEIFAFEEAADRLKNDLRSHLPKSLFMPVDRRDLLEVLQMQDSIADTAQDIAGLLVERSMTVPEPLAENLVKLARQCVACCEQAGKIIEELDELLTTGFRGREADRVLAMVDELNRLEDESDEMGIALSRALFTIEDDLKPVSVMMWYRLIEWVGDLGDYAEKVGDRLRLLIAR